ncbi:MAG: prolipoprotein diacylglyceryl transferase [Paracoccaceae bacterium]|nr:prolipoprotein diacylglyceryl transferase [Paracoccaceae bacterium]MDE3123709.1 prolipoprotein diacylglyceryl transferase [Paracoccaceae bacterium]MDE3238444.1 prolipoprotein diacylglyceryl transferase [Paracoccaceae bacterium]
MHGYIPFPDISPEVFSVTIGGYSFALRWYALAYITGILIGWRMVVGLVKTPRLWPAGQAPMVPRQVEDLLTYVILGVVLGGRIGYVLFYDLPYYLKSPIHILEVWHGGMSFHGGFLGVALALTLYCRAQKIPLLSAADALAVATPPGLMLGRIANFINGELWGLPSHLPWAVAFPGPEAQNCGPDWLTICTRHPSQIYEALMEGVILGLVLLYVVWRRGWLKYPGSTAGLFFAGYGLARFIVEFFRQADPQFITSTDPAGNVISFGHHLGGLSMGQVLSLPMIAVGLGVVFWARRRGKRLAAAPREQA